MDERELLILGLLMAQSQHGYQINDFIERNLGRVSDMKKATAYSLLKRLNQSGYVHVTVEQEGNRPPRQVYTIAPEGEKRFYDLLHTALSHTEDMTPSGDIGLMFLDHLPLKEVIDNLQKRVDKLELVLQTYARGAKHGNGLGVDLSIEHRVYLMQADRDWLLTVIGRLKEQGA